MTKEKYYIVDRIVGYRPCDFYILSSKKKVTKCANNATLYISSDRTNSDLSVCRDCAIRLGVNINPKRCQVCKHILEDPKGFLCCRHQQDFLKVVICKHIFTKYDLILHKTTIYCIYDESDRFNVIIDDLFEYCLTECPYHEQMKIEHFYVSEIDAFRELVEDFTAQNFF